LRAYGGYTGPAIKPITQRHVSEVARATQIPISAVGGVSTWEDVIEYMMIGATTIQICTSVMWHGYDFFEKVLDDLSNYMKREGLDSLEQIRGKALPHIVPIEQLANEPALMAQVDPDRCTNLLKGGCELCGKSCFYGAIAFDPKLILYRDKCDGCGLCVEVCPTAALKLLPE
jgi:dihydropyrimidine dehydrogenase (NAD+) subunit PreA